MYKYGRRTEVSMEALSGSNTAMHGMKFKKVGENMGNSNHKGKL